ncbi:MAG: hypothetical protein K2K80_00290 [Clostridia bacterium]|nr:hypothetical protein [Clostridia bacterium]
MDIKKRKKRKIAVSVVLIIWVIAAAIAFTLEALGVLPEHIAGYSGYVAIAFAVYFCGTWALCWVGFPAGWNSMAKERAQAKSEAYLVLNVDENGNVSSRIDSLSPKLGTLIMSFIVGALSMCVSIVIAIAILFQTKGEIKTIERILSLTE